MHWGESMNEVTMEVFTQYEEPKALPTKGIRVAMEARHDGALPKLSNAHVYLGRNLGRGGHHRNCDNTYSALSARKEVAPGMCNRGTQIAFSSIPGTVDRVLFLLRPSGIPAFILAVVGILLVSLGSVGCALPLFLLLKLVTNNQSTDPSTTDAAIQEVDEQTDTSWTEGQENLGSGSSRFANTDGTGDSQ